MLAFPLPRTPRRAHAFAPCAREAAQANLRALQRFFEYQIEVERALFDRARQVEPGLLLHGAVVADGPGAGSVTEALADLVALRARWFGRWYGDERAAQGCRSHLATLAAVEQAWAALLPDLGTFLARLRPVSLDRPVRYRTHRGRQQQVAPLWRTLLHAAEHAGHVAAQARTGLDGLTHQPRLVSAPDAAALA